MHRPKLDASHSAVRALSVSAYNRGCMWHVSAPHRPCIGHRTGYSLHAKISLHTAQACDCVSRFRGVFAHSYKRCRPRLFLRALRELGRTERWYRWKPPIQLQEEQAIAVRELDPTAHLALKYNQLTSERGILSLKPADRPERRNHSLKRKKSSSTILADAT